MMLMMPMVGIVAPPRGPVIRNGQFNDTSYWIVTDAVISGGVCNGSTGVTNFLQQDGRLQNGVVYNFSIDWTTTINHGGGGLRCGDQLGTMALSGSLLDSSSGTFTGTFTGSSSGNFVLQANGSPFYGTVDNIIVTRQ